MNCIYRLKSLMRKRKMTIYRLSKLSGVSESTLRNMFKRGSDPSVKTLELLCEALGVTLAEFFMEEDMELYSLKKDEQEIIIAYRTRDYREKDLIKRVILPRND